MLKLVIFDFDGLMVNSEEVVYEAIEEIFTQYDQHFTWEYFLHHIGMPVKESLELFYRDHPISISFQEFYNLRNERVHTHLSTKLRVMPGLLTLLNTLKSADIDTAIASSGNRPYILDNLKKLKIDKYFQTIVTIDDVKKGKPNPDIFLKVLTIQHAEKKHALVLEDSPLGIQAAKRAGIATIAVPFPGVAWSKFEEADAICSDLQKVEKLVKLNVPAISK